MRTMDRVVAIIFLFTATTTVEAARLGPAHRIGAVGTGPAFAQLGALLPYGEGQVAFTRQLDKQDRTRYDIVATPIDRRGVVQYDLARTIVRGADSAPLAAATSSGYLICWVFRSEVFTLPLTPSLDLRSGHVNDVGKGSPLQLVCSDPSCLLTFNDLSLPARMLLTSDGAELSSLSLPSYALPSAVSVGYAFGDPTGISWLDPNGHLIRQTTIPYPYGVITAHRDGALVVTFSQSGLRASVVSPERGVLKTAEFAFPGNLKYESFSLRAVVVGGGANYLVALAINRGGIAGTGDEPPDDLGALIITADLDLVRPWSEVAVITGGSRMFVSASVKEPGYFVGYGNRVAAFTTTGPLFRLDGMALALAPSSQERLALAASPDGSLPVWANSRDERQPALLARFDHAGNTLDTPPLTMDVDGTVAVSNGTRFALFGGRYSNPGNSAFDQFLTESPNDLMGAYIDDAGALHQTLIKHAVHPGLAWWDGSAYVMVANTVSLSPQVSHLLRISPDMTVISDVSLPLIGWAAGVPGRTMLSRSDGDQKTLTIVDDRGATIQTVTLAVPLYSFVTLSSNGRDEFLVIASGAGTLYASRFSRDGKALDDITKPLPTSAAYGFAEGFGDHWLMVTSTNAFEYPSLKPVDLAAAGTIAAMARASYDRIVLLCSETVTVDDVPLRVLTLRDLVGDPLPRRRAAH